MNALAFVLAAALQSHPANAAVTELYAHVIRHQPLGIPEGDAKAAMWPLLSERLRNVLDTAQACEFDYFRTHAHSTDKPEFGWLEYGLFSGGNEQALPAEMTIVSTEPLSQSRFRVRVQLVYRETFETYGRPPDPANCWDWPVDVFVECGERRCVIDDVEVMEGELLSEGFDGCDGPRWVE